MEILIINGPNLNLLGVREKKIYGEVSFEHFFDELKTNYSEIDLTYFQSNNEGAIIDQLHKVGFKIDGIILNAGAYTHTSVAIADAIAAIQVPVIEVHISNIHAREAFRQKSFMSKNCLGTIAGLGLTGYELAMRYFLTNSNKQNA